MCWTAHTQSAVRAVRLPDSADAMLAHIEQFLGKRQTGSAPVLRRLERTKQFAVRAVRLPDSADTEHIQGKYENGVLTLKARPWRVMRAYHPAGMCFG